jgi:hypothetical protein
MNQREKKWEWIGYRSSPNSLLWPHSKVQLFELVEGIAGRDVQDEDAPFGFPAEAIHAEGLMAGLMSSSSGCLPVYLSTSPSKSVSTPSRSRRSGKMLEAVLVLVAFALLSGLWGCENPSTPAAPLS